MKLHGYSGTILTRGIKDNIQLLYVTPLKVLFLKQSNLKQMFCCFLFEAVMSNIQDKVHKTDMGLDFCGWKVTHNFILFYICCILWAFFSPLTSLYSITLFQHLTSFGVFIFSMGLVSLFKELQCLGEPNWRSRNVKVGGQGGWKGAQHFNSFSLFFFFFNMAQTWTIIPTHALSVRLRPFAFN